MKNTSFPVNILVVDDRPANLIALAETLAPLGQNVVTANSGEAALKYLLGQEFAVILLDVQMPTMDGFELANIIHARPGTSQTPILFLTAISREQVNVLKGYSVGAVDYLVKPIVPEILLAKVSVFIDLFNTKNELKKQTEELQAAYESLQKKQQEISKLNYYKELILNAVGDGIYGVDCEGQTTFLNPAGAKMLGYTQAEVMKKPECLIVNTDLMKKGDGTSACPVYDSLQDGCIHSYEGNFQRKDGSSFPAEYVSMPVVEQGEIVGAVITFKDITERRKLEKMKDDFIAIASHELRNPVTGIYGYLQLLTQVDYKDQPEKPKKMLESALHEANRLLKLTNNLLDLQRLQVGQFILTKQDCIASYLMQQSVRELQDLADRSEVVLHIIPLPVQVWADPNAIQQVFTNLVTNAIKFSPPNTTICLSAEVVESPEQFPLSFQSKISLPCLLFSCKDEGRGIPHDKLELIFERFEQVDKSDSRRKGGSGLGLAICKSIVEQHEGFIWAESVLNQGSIFHFTLPLKRDEEDPR